MKTVRISRLEDAVGKTPPGGGGRWHRLIESADTEAGLIFGFGRLRPGEGRGWHVHPAGEDEIFFVIEGEGLAQWKVDGRVQQAELPAGSAFYTPGDLENNVINMGTQDLLSVYCIHKPLP
jgi:mannose-6-phosphate isomerase-like protein (cupin superfamily)